MNILDKIRKVTTINPKWAIPVISCALGYKTLSQVTQHNMDNDPSDDEQFCLEGWAASVGLGRTAVQSLFYNAAFFFRFVLPFGVWVGVRWAGKDPSKKEYIQVGFGYKLSGVLGGVFRIQSDESAAAGTTGPNYDQAVGWWGGTK